MIIVGAFKIVKTVNGTRLSFPCETIAKFKEDKFTKEEINNYKFWQRYLWKKQEAIYNKLGGDDLTKYRFRVWLSGGTHKFKTVFPPTHKKTKDGRKVTVMEYGKII